jgi:hypothetical protein
MQPDHRQVRAWSPRGCRTNRSPAVSTRRQPYRPRRELLVQGDYLDDEVPGRSTRRAGRLRCQRNHSRQVVLSGRTALPFHGCSLQSCPESRRPCDRERRGARRRRSGGGASAEPRSGLGSSRFLRMIASSIRVLSSSMGVRSSWLSTPEASTALTCCFAVASSSTDKNVVLSVVTGSDPPGAQIPRGVLVARAAVLVNVRIFPSNTVLGVRGAASCRPAAARPAGPWGAG